MPSFEALIIGAPIGFVKASKNLNSLLENDEQLAKDVISKAISASKSPSNASHAVETTNIPDIHHDLYQCIVFVIQCFLLAVPSVDVIKFATILDTHSFFTRSSIEAIVNGIKSYSEPSALLFQIQNKQIKNLEWKLGVALTSSTCKTLLVPYVSLKFDVIDKNGHSCSHSLEMSQKDFKEFRKEFQKMLTVMDRL